MMKEQEPCQKSKVDPGSCIGPLPVLLLEKFLQCKDRGFRQLVVWPREVSGILETKPPRCPDAVEPVGERQEPAELLLATVRARPRFPWDEPRPASRRLCMGI